MTGATQLMMPKTGCLTTTTIGFGHDFKTPVHELARGSNLLIVAIREVIRAICAALLQLPP